MQEVGDLGRDSGAGAVRFTKQFTEGLNVKAQAGICARPLKLIHALSLKESYCIN
ncbi:hypothetical protein [Virgibacillus sp. DJP39]|uniref:hypothetical protein n=1 Tax=Virgibacillus sp. DJP39 TaxID=3409790 RepID=UPI003BB4951E